MIAAREHYPKLTPEDYFAWEERQELKHEYLDGEVYAMSGGTLNHSEIAVNFVSMLRAHLRDSGCRVLNSDARVNIQASTNYVYPDASVTCDERDRTNTQFIANPCLIVEVLSDSTEAYDRGDKFAMYRRSTSLKEYVLVSSNKIAIELFRKDESFAALPSRGRWDIINYTAGDTVELESVGLTFAIELMFENIIFDS